MGIRIDGKKADDIDTSGTIQASTLVADTFNGASSNFFEGWETGAISGTDWPTSTEWVIDSSEQRSGSYCGSVEPTIFPVPTLTSKSYKNIREMIFYFKFITTGFTRPYIYLKDSNGNYVVKLYVEATAGSKTVSIYDPHTNTVVSSTNILNDTYYKFRIYVDGSTVHIYIDDVEKASYNLTAPMDYFEMISNDGAFTTNYLDDISINSYEDIDILSNLDLNLANISNVGTLTASTLTDDTLSISSGSITSAVNGTFSGSITAGTLTMTGADSDANASQIGSATAYTKIGAWDIIGAETSNFISSEAICLFGLGEDDASTEPMAIFAGADVTSLRSPKLRLTGWGSSGLGDAHQDFTLQAVSGGAASIETSTGDIKLVAASDIDADSNNLKNVATLSATTLTDGTTSISSGAITGVVSEVLTPGSAPGTPVEGMLYYDSTANKLKVYTGSAWETVTSS